MARYALLFIGTEDGWDDLSKEEIARTYEKLNAWWHDLETRGIAKAARELDHSSKAMSVRHVNGRVQVMDGPFVESKEQIGGIAAIEVKDLDEAIAIAKSWTPREFTIELRPIVEH